VAESAPAEAEAEAEGVAVAEAVAERAHPSVAVRRVPRRLPPGGLIHGRAAAGAAPAVIHDPPLPPLIDAGSLVGVSGRGGLTRPQRSMWVSAGGDHGLGRAMAGRRAWWDATEAVVRHQATADGVARLYALEARAGASRQPTEIN
jgi:hypothetical protein